MKEWKATAVEPKSGWFCAEERFGVTVIPEVTGPSEVAVHVDYAGRGDAADAAAVSLYMDPTDALLLAERVKIAAEIALDAGPPEDEDV